MQRRNFLALVGTSAAAWPLTARAQSDGRLRRVGVLISNPNDDPNGSGNMSTLRRALGEFGWLEPRNLHIEERWTGGDAARLQDHVRELLALAPDAILATHITAVQALREATRTIPIVFVSVSDPVENGLIAELSQPEANVTGVMLYEQSLIPKWLGLLKEMAPQVRRVVVLCNADTAAPWAPFHMRAAREAGERLALKIVASDLRSEREIEEVVAATADIADGGLVVLPDLFNASHRATIIVRAGKLGVPAIYPARFYSVGGGLMSYGPNLAGQCRDVARYIDRILRGTKPADLPVQFASRFELVINLKIAKTMGLPVPPQLLARADEVIE